MNICKPLPRLLRRLRTARGLSQVELCELSGLSPTIVSRAESGLRPVSRKTLLALCKALQVSFDRVRELTGWRPTSGGRGRTSEQARLEREFGSPATFIPPGSRTFEERLFTARCTFRGRVGELEARVDARSDRKELERRLAALPSDSASEVLYALHLLALGATFEWLSPLRLGFADPRVLQRENRRYVGHCLMPALVLRLGSLVAVFFPQVPLRVDHLGPLALDFLVGVQDRGFIAWRNVEIDGKGHNPNDDDERDRLVALGTLRYRDPDLLNPSFEVRLQEDLARAMEAARRLQAARALR